MTPTNTITPTVTPTITPTPTCECFIWEFRNLASKDAKVTYKTCEGPTAVEIIPVGGTATFCLAAIVLMEPEGQVEANFIDCCNVPPTPTPTPTITPTPTCDCFEFEVTTIDDKPRTLTYRRCGDLATISQEIPPGITIICAVEVLDSEYYTFQNQGCCPPSYTATPTPTPTPTPTCDCLLIRFENFTVNEGQVTYRACPSGFVGTSPVPPGGNLNICTNELIDYDVFLDGPNIIGTCCDV